MISLVLNTSALGPKAKETPGSDGRTVPHAFREYALRNFLLPLYCADPYLDEVIVVGEWEPGPGYKYIHVPSVHFSSADALAQRQVGFEASKGNVVIHCHDDHWLQPLTSAAFAHDSMCPEWDDYRAGPCHGCPLKEEGDVLIPQRWTRLRRPQGERLNNGEGIINPNLHGPYMSEMGYVSGHCAVYRREVLETCPWRAVEPTRTWDICHTQQMRAAGFHVVWSEALKVYDVEHGSTPWL